MRSKVILLCIVIEVLRTIRKVKARHPADCAIAGKIKLGEILGQPGADCAEYPIQITISLNADPFV